MPSSRQLPAIPLWAWGLGLVFMTLLGLVYRTARHVPEPVATAHQASHASVAPKNDTRLKSPIPISNASVRDTAPITATASNPSSPSAATPVPASIPASKTPVGQTPLPQNDALAKEELDRLNDNEQRLLLQKANLTKQLKDTSQILNLKQQQIAALEQQLAQHPS